MSSLALHQITAIESSPLELVQIAAQVSCQEVCIFVRSPERKAGNGKSELLFPTATPEIIEEFKTTLALNNIGVMNAEYFPIEQGTNLEDYRLPLSIAADVGARRIVVHVHETNESVSLGRLGELCDMSAELGLLVGLEFMGLSPGCRSLSKARHLVESVDRPNLGIAIDALHLVRTGGTIGEVADLDPKLIAYVQLCDGKDLLVSDDYLPEAFNRLVPGEGRFPLRDLIRVLPENVQFDVEVPSEDLLQLGIDPLDRARCAVDASRKLLAAAINRNT